uniref:Uncharacterized protein n=1 Tax=Oryza punctata TaxID=4537 RepID=A0A0E0KAL3_ORYPU
MEDDESWSPPLCVAIVRDRDFDRLALSATRGGGAKCGPCTQGPRPIRPCIAAVRRTVSMMGSRGTSAMLSRAARMRQKLQSALEASALDIEDVSYQHAGHAAVKDNANETHFNIRIISPKFEGQSLVKRHRMVYDLLTDELNSGLHAISIVAKTPKECIL